MGYTSDVRIVMTKKCWDYVKENAPKIYEAIRIAKVLKADVYDVFPLDGEGEQ